MKKKLLDAIKEKSLLADGAMGTQLMLAGLMPGCCGERWNLIHPEKVLAIQKRYADAGSDCLLTNTFGANRIMLNRYGNADKAVEINQAGVEIARHAFGSREGYVIGDICPFGALTEVRDAFNEQANALVDAGVDAIIIETQISLEELQIGIEAAKQAGAACIIGSMAYDATRDASTPRTMMGVDPEHAAEFMQEHGADIVALNCGKGMDMPHVLLAVQQYRKACDLPLMVQPNAGQPKLVDMKICYNETPEQMARGVVPLLEAGTNILGACCGSGAEHIGAFRREIDRFIEGTIDEHR
jgi:5-methyltetrahydrofolate--homocysteine methyltransferase